MAGNETGDILMIVLSAPGVVMAGEGSSVLDAADPKFIGPLLPSPLLKGFAPGKMFELSEFQFGIATLSDSKKAAGGKASNKVMSAIAKSGAKVGAELASAAAGFIKDGNLPVPGDPQGEAKSCPVEPVTFSRPIDKASTELLNYCIKCTTLHGAVFVKRKPAGGPLAGEAYLRLEFVDVLFTDIAWSNGEVIEERCTFITRAVNVLYRPQLPNGKLGAVKNGFWSRKAESQGEKLTYP